MNEMRLSERWGADILESTDLRILVFKPMTQRIINIGRRSFVLVTQKIDQLPHESVTAVKIQ